MINSFITTVPMQSENIIDASLTEILGKAGLAAALEFARLSQSELVSKKSHLSIKIEYPLLSNALETLYGQQTGTGIAHRIGQVAFRYFLFSYGKELGFSELDFRLLPLQHRIKNGLEQISRFINFHYHIPTSIHSEKEYHVVQLFDCPECKGRTSDGKFCSFITGFLQEYLAWMGGGRFFQVKESSCKANGSSCCAFELARRPLD